MKRFFAWIVLCSLVIGSAAAWMHYSTKQAPPTYRTVPLERGTLRVSISATGTIQPEEIVDVGAQVAGKIQSLGRDPRDPDSHIDYRSLVEQGTVLAEIDASIYKTQVDRAHANLQRAKAELSQNQSRLRQTEREWGRAQNLRMKKTITESEYDTAQANFESAQAMVLVAQAALSLAQAESEQAEINLGYTTIRSPVKGVIVDRRVNVGQTVVASLNAPSLFLIAKDLTRLQVWASVNEADIGQIHAGQVVRFSVDAFPKDEFMGVVKQIRLNATMTQNVVTYTVVINTDNEDGKLLPYLTANVRFELDSRENVLIVPSSALRYQPTTVAALTPDGHSDSKGKKPAPTEGPGPGQIWVLEGDQVRRIAVQTGLTDGAQTEVEAPELKEGMQVVIGEVKADAGPARSPFAPTLRGSGGGGPGGGGRG